MELEKFVGWWNFKALSVKIPFEILKSNIHHIDVETLRTSETRRRFVKEIQNHIDSSSDWDKDINSIVGV